jgi:Rad3-related DNA helicase
MDPAEIIGSFPAPSFRGYQRQALLWIQDAFEDGNDVVLVQAPTGSGKSLLARAVAGAASSDSGEYEAGSYYTTPQVSQIDAVAEDEFLDYAMLSGKSNYTCDHPDVEAGTPVNQAPCSLNSNFECPHYDACTYFTDYEDAQMAEHTAMTLALFMQHAITDAFPPRDVLVVDEAHGLMQWAQMYGTIELGPDTIPNWDHVVPESLDSLLDCVWWAARVNEHLQSSIESLRGRRSLDKKEATQLSQWQRLQTNLEWMLGEEWDAAPGPEVAEDQDWVYQQRDDGTVVIKPLEPARLLQHTVWDRANAIVLFSATILDDEAFCRRVGLPTESTAFIDVPHTFPLENRPLHDVRVGKMTSDERAGTIPPMAERLARIMAAHPDEHGLIHCHSYDIQKKLYKELSEYRVPHTLHTHDSDDRDAALASWLNTDQPSVFLGVKLEEALDLKGDLARWQALCKTPYPHAGDPLVSQRLEDDEWGWYYRTTLRTVIQACGRVVRAPDDWGHTYVLDSSFQDLFERTRGSMPNWFREAVDEMTVPSLPPTPTPRV